MANNVLGQFIEIITLWALDRFCIYVNLQSEKSLLRFTIFTYFVSQLVGAIVVGLVFIW